MRIRMAHASLQFSDNDKQHTQDITKIFDRCTDRRVAFLTGTEAGPGAGNIGEELLRLGKEADYRMYVPSERKGAGHATDCWLGVRKDLVLGDWKPEFTPVIPGSRELYERAGVNKDQPRWGPKGVVAVTFQSLPQIGDVGLAAAHHLTKGQRKGPDSVIHGVDHWEWNEKLDDALGRWMAKAGKGSALAFVGMDRNASDRRNPAEIPGGESIADELKAWQNTGHGDIDWIVSHKKDGRVRGVNFNVLDDKEFFLHDDHFFLEATFDVRGLNTKR